MPKLINLILSLLFFGTSCSGDQTAPSEGASAGQQREAVAVTAEDGSGDGMQAAKASFKKKYPNVQQLSWGKDANGYYEASFEEGGEKYRADFTKEGSWVETESSLKYKDLPQAVQAVIEKNYEKVDITEIEKVDNAEKGIFFDVEFKQKGKNQDIEIRENGEIIR